MNPTRWLFSWSKQPGENVEADGSPEELFSTEGGYGLQEIFIGVEVVADLVFVHGLTGNRNTTWTYKKSIFWPKSLLVDDLPNVRIMTFGYNADIMGVLKTVGSNTIRDHGKSLASDLALHRLRTGSNLRPLIFVAHSLGGLVVEQALLIARGSSQSHENDLLESTNAIAFMGTPHLGSSKADLAGPITQLGNLLRKTNSEIVAVLQPASEMLANLQQEFHTMLEARRKKDNKTMELYCFYEEVAYPGIGKIVSSQSSILTSYGNAPIPAHHSNMTKFKSKNDIGYVRVSNQLWLWVKNIQNIPQPRDGNNSRQERDFGTNNNGPIQSSGGPIFFAPVTASRDIRTINVSSPTPSLPWHNNETLEDARR